jgi:hypothetical protein
MKDLKEFVYTISYARNLLLIVLSDLSKSHDTLIIWPILTFRFRGYNILSKSYVSTFAPSLSTKALNSPSPKEERRLPS